MGRKTTFKLKRIAECFLRIQNKLEINKKFIWEIPPKLLQLHNIFKPWVKIIIMKYGLDENATYQHLCAAKTVNMKKFIT